MRINNQLQLSESQGRTAQSISHWSRFTVPGQLGLWEVAQTRPPLPAAPIGFGRRTQASGGRGNLGFLQIKETFAIGFNKSRIEPQGHDPAPIDFNRHFPTDVYEGLSVALN
ncbi:hypothetical protein UY3_04318 [Chelonia mydas]|uniref:Uncharacterized protein n=1 Tax=Chelonia mydas TaxID=8469 RepID=M7BKN5_CHEMY|nr:hypothetical protein UY3_04318 [Chelonia mydas]